MTYLHSNDEIVICVYSMETIQTNETKTINNSGILD